MNATRTKKTAATSLFPLLVLFAGLAWQTCVADEPIFQHQVVRVRGAVGQVPAGRVGAWQRRRSLRRHPAGWHRQFRHGKGSGTINGEGNYIFMLTAVDGQVVGGGGSDRFRIKIWEQGSGEIIYDNQPGSDDNAALNDTTILSGGSIVIHK
jgi:hypothetical protein